MSSARRAIVCGGSLGGLFAAAALARAGWQVSILERSDVALAGRGAGIVTHKELIDALHTIGATTDELGVMVRERVAYDLSGDRVRSLDFPQLVTSWDRMYRVLRDTVAPDCYRLGHAVTHYVDRGTHVDVHLADGTLETADICVGADGFRSAVRARMLPEIQPEYAGYVVWRTLAQEAALSDSIRRSVFPFFGVFAPNGAQVIGYPIAGRNNDLRPGHRQYNFVWYARVGMARLDDMLTDTKGRRHAMSIPPPLVRDEIIAQAKEDASNRLPAPFVEILDASDRPFFTPIYDHHSPVMGRGRIALVGDAACVARPHAGMGVTKAALDALSLADHLDSDHTENALEAYSKERVAEAHRAFARSRRLGGFIFDGPDDCNQDGRSHPDLDTVLRETAVVV